MAMYSEYFNKSALRKLGWNEAMIKEFKLEPDRYAENPRYSRSWKLMKLYLKSKVNAIMRTKEFKDRVALKRQRSEKIRDGYDAAIKRELDAWVDDPEDDGPWAHLMRFVRDNSSEGSGQSESSSGA